MAGNVFIQIAIFEVDAPLKCMPQQSKFDSGACITEKKNQCQGLHYNPPCNAGGIRFNVKFFNIGLGRRYAKCQG